LPNNIHHPGTSGTCGTSGTSGTRGTSGVQFLDLVWQFVLQYPSQSFNKINLDSNILCLYLYPKLKHMNTEKMKSIITDEVVERLTQVIEGMSNNEFIELIIDKYQEETGNEIDEENWEEVKDMVGEKVLPLFGKVSEYILETHLKK
jgi:predicted house-cleaning noncanonical NTP pyrophosphatase (MazG superfamily)